MDMAAGSFDAEAYLHRIGLDAAVGADQAGLQRLHLAHAYAVPFENFDIMIGRGVNIEPDAVFDKIVRHRRGGYCFELNGLFLRALRHFGFKVQPLLARVHLRGEPSSLTHQLILVAFSGEQWIADIGFGANGLRAPIPLKADRIHEQDGVPLRLIDDPEFGYMLQSEEDYGWQDIYSFHLHRVYPPDVEMGNFYTSTCPASFFTQARMATLPLPEGRNTLLNFRLHIQRGGEKTVHELPPGQAYLDALEEHFGISLDVPYEDIGPFDTAG